MDFVLDFKTFKKKNLYKHIYLCSCRLDLRKETEAREEGIEMTSVIRQPLSLF